MDIEQRHVVADPESLEQGERAPLGSPVSAALSGELVDPVVVLIEKAAEWRWTEASTELTRGRCCGCRLH